MGTFFFFLDQSYFKNAFARLEIHLASNSNLHGRGKASVLVCWLLVSPQPTGGLLSPSSGEQWSPLGK